MPGDPVIDDRDLARLLGAYRRVAVVGLSVRPERASHGVARYLIREGYTVIPVNPNYPEVLGLRSYPSLLDVPGPVEIVDVFRRPDAVPEVVDQAIARGAKVLWLQEGVIHEPAARRAAAHGMTVVMDRCILREHLRLIRALRS
ncbi:MAG: CoA-binding protein [Armatimonadetes bacterium]|nr:CoA-binding protein [Armatimonadota bacterium]